MLNELADIKTAVVASAEAKAAELTIKEGVKVHPMIFKGNGDDNDWAIGFIKEPQRIAKARAMDKSLMGQPFSLGIDVLEACIIKEESDPRILSEKSEHDNINLGAINFAGSLIRLSIEQSEKKN